MNTSPYKLDLKFVFCDNQVRFGGVPKSAVVVAFVEKKLFAFYVENIERAQREITDKCVVYVEGRLKRSEINNYNQATVVVTFSLENNQTHYAE